MGVLKNMKANFKTLLFEGGLVVLGGGLAVNYLTSWSLPVWILGIGAAGLAVSGAMHLFGK